MVGLLTMLHNETAGEAAWRGCWRGYTIRLLVRQHDELLAMVHDKVAGEAV
jgi:hypothetical protein